MLITLTSKHKTSLLLIITILLSAHIPSYSQQIYSRDQLIEKAVNEISSDSLKRHIQDLLSFYTRSNLSSKNDTKTGIGAASRFIFKKIDTYSSNSKTNLNVKSFDYKAGGKETRLGKDIILTNVVATFNGSDKSDNRVIALLAHYDNRTDNNNDSTSFAPGANDNGSGVAALIEIARVLSTIELPITIKLMFLSGEEHGLLGAEFMAQMAQKEGWNLIAVINNDMIGNSSASETDSRNNSKLRLFSENIPAFENEEMRRERVFNSSENDSPSRQLARYIKETGERYVMNMDISLVYRNDRFGRGGDHTPFCKKGFTAVRISEYYENYNRTHQPIMMKNGIQFGDLIDGVDFEYVRKNAGVNIASILNLSLAPSIPDNAKIDISTLSGDTYVSWESPLIGKKPYAFYLLIRNTDNSQWEQKILIKNTSVRIPLSRDNYFFGVQSVDEYGHESLPVLAIGSK